MVRVFVALELEPQLRAKLSEAQQSLRGCGARLSFVNPDIIHITLKFLGEVNEKDIPQVKDALRKVTCTPFTIRATHVTVDNPNRPRTIWSTIEDDGKITGIFQRIEEALEPLGVARETRRFTPHATIARIKNPAPGLIPAVSKFKDFSAGESKVTGFKLKKSTLTPQGPLYEDLLEVSW